MDDDVNHKHSDEEGKAQSTFLAQAFDFIKQSLHQVQKVHCVFRVWRNGGQLLDLWGSSKKGTREQGKKRKKRKEKRRKEKKENERK